MDWSTGDVEDGLVAAAGYARENGRLEGYGGYTRRDVVLADRMSE